MKGDIPEKYKLVVYIIKQNGKNLEASILYPKRNH